MRQYCRKVAQVGKWLVVQVDDGVEINSRSTEEFPSEIRVVLRACHLEVVIVNANLPSWVRRYWNVRTMSGTV